jgi:hypothetical protein
MATPHVAGQVAIYLSTHKDATPSDVMKFLKGSALSKKIAGIRESGHSVYYLLITHFFIASGTANLFLNNGHK